MLTERTLWLSATTVVIGILLLLILQPPAGRRVRTTPRFDDPAPRPAIWRMVTVAAL